MKNLEFVLLFVIFTVLVTSCKSSHKPCDSYGNKGTSFAPAKKIDFKKNSMLK